VRLPASATLLVVLLHVFACELKCLPKSEGENGVGSYETGWMRGWEGVEALVNAAADAAL
jgi:hypothetical protein